MGQQEVSAEVRADVSAKLLDILSWHTGVNKDEINCDSHFVDDLGADSLDQVEALMAIEEEFAIEITDEEAESLSTFDELLKYVANRVINRE